MACAMTDARMLQKGYLAMTDLLARLRDADTTRRIGESYADTHERRQRDREEAAACIERLESDLSDALTDLNTAQQDNASCTVHIHNQAARIEKLEATLQEIDTACSNPGSWSPVVMERIIERVQELSRAALEKNT